MKMLSRVRILPIAIALAVAVLGLRIGDAWRHSGSAHAQQPPAQPAQAPAAQAPAEAPLAAPVGAAPSSPARALDDITNLTANEIEVLQQLVVRRAEIERRGAELSRREAVLKAAEERIQAKIEEMKKLQAGVEQAIRRYDEQEEQRRKSLVKIDRKSTRLNSSHVSESRMPSSA